MDSSAANRNTHMQCMHAQARRTSPGPGQYDVDGSAAGHALERPSSTLGGPAFTMGARTRPVGQAIAERDAAAVPGPGGGCCGVLLG